MVEFIRDVVVVLALLMSLFALAYHAPGEIENARNPTANDALVHTGKITMPVAPAVTAAK